jgi:hypothetical protein
MHFTLVFYVPQDHAEAVKKAVFDAGAGRIGLYDSCSWECAGTGQFRPLQGSNPFIGRTGMLETVSELRIECVVKRDCLEGVLQALLSAHPYEQPAYHCHPVMTLEDSPWIP